jgi:hypothetical protein
VNKSLDATERFDVRIIPDAQTLWTDAPSGQDRCGFGKDKSCATDRTRTEVCEMQVIREIILTRISTHW